MSSNSPQDNGLGGHQNGGDMLLKWGRNAGTASRTLAMASSATQMWVTGKSSKIVWHWCSDLVPFLVIISKAADYKLWQMHKRKSQIE